jgi:predicted kinase
MLNRAGALPRLGESVVLDATWTSAQCRAQAAQMQDADVAARMVSAAREY